MGRRNTEVGIPIGNTISLAVFDLIAKTAAVLARKLHHLADEERIKVVKWDWLSYDHLTLFREARDGRHAQFFPTSRSTVLRKSSPTSLATCAAFSSATWV